MVEIIAVDFSRESETLESLKLQVLCFQRLDRIPYLYSKNTLSCSAWCGLKEESRGSIELLIFKYLYSTDL